VRPRLDPARLTARPELVLVRPYERPHQVGSILLPQTAYADPSAVYYEVVSAGDRTADAAGMELKPDDIVRLPRLEATVDTGHDDLEGRPILACKASFIHAVTRWKTETDNEQAEG
jgi:hypothetical protein